MAGGKNVGFVNIDQPVIGDSMGQTDHAIGPVGYIRMHGRNHENWFREDAERDARYDFPLHWKGTGVFDRDAPTGRGFGS